MPLEHTFITVAQEAYIRNVIFMSAALGLRMWLTVT